MNSVDYIKLTAYIGDWEQNAAFKVVETTREAVSAQLDNATKSILNALTEEGIIT